MKKKILILKNDRAGDLFTSLKLISSLMTKENDITIFLSELNHGFSFFFKDTKIKKINFNLNIFEKIYIFFNILTNKYDKIYILSPKYYYFFLPLVFNNIKFYSIVYNNKRNRPSNLLRKFLYKYRIIYRNKINSKSYRDLQLELLDDENLIDNEYNNLNIPIISEKYKSLLPKKFILFQFRYLFFEKLGWGINEFNILMKKILKKYDYILFTTDFENNNFTKKYNNFFEKNYSIIDTSNYINYINNNNDKIFYLKNIDSLNLFLIIKESEINLAKEGIFSHISYFHKTKCHNLFNFKLNSKNDFLHEKISYSEWCKGMNFNFSFLNRDIHKASRKILKNI